jgi:hypothetical protein
MSYSTRQIGPAVPYWFQLCTMARDVSCFGTKRHRAERHGGPASLQFPQPRPPAATCLVNQRRLQDPRKGVAQDAAEVVEEGRVTDLRTRAAGASEPLGTAVSRALKACLPQHSSTPRSRVCALRRSCSPSCQPHLVQQHRELRALHRQLDVVSHQLPGAGHAIYPHGLHDAPHDVHALHPQATKAEPYA